MSKHISINELFAENVRKHMSDQGKVQDGVSAAARRYGSSVNQRTVGRAIGNGNPTLKTLDAIALGLGVQPWQLLMPDNVANFPKSGPGGEMLSALAELNEDGVKAAIAHARFLASQPQYQLVPKAKRK